MLYGRRKPNYDLSRVSKVTITWAPVRGFTSSNQPPRPTRPPPVDGIDGKMTGAMLFGWEGSRRSGVALTMRHGLCCLSAVSVA